MSPDGLAILDHLRSVANERRQRAADLSLERRTLALKDYQHRRFARTYADLLALPHYAGAARFFLDELYGPHDFSARDAQFERVVPGLVRLFPAAIVQTVRSLAELHALSEWFDTEVARHLTDAPISAAAYVMAWQQTGHEERRYRQIALMMAVGQALERYTRNPVLRHSLRLMRGPARAAGLSALQGFLETGFDTFGALRDAGAFLKLVEARERVLCDALFDAPVGAEEGLRSGPLGELP